MFVYLLLIASCRKEEASPAPVAPVTPVADAGLDPVDVVVSVRKNGVLASGLTPTISLSRGSKSVTLDNGDGTYSFRITPTQTGELTVNLNNNSTISDGALRGLSSTNWTSFQLPTKINTVANEEVMPFFTGTGLYYAKIAASLIEVYYAPYTGTHTQADLTDNYNWGASVKVLASDPSSASLGRIVGVGEPTIATTNGEEYLYFVYVVFRSYDVALNVADLDFQAGFIKKN